LRTWSLFRLAFPSFGRLYKASKQEIFETIKEGGLGKWKAERIYKLLRQVEERFGKFSLASLARLEDNQLEKELLKLDGIGIKSARCVMMYSFKREVFPVDTHVLRIVKRLGFRTGKGSIRSVTFANIIQEQVSRRYRYRLHVNLVQHGRKICKRKPNCGICPISDLCLMAKKKGSKSRCL
jgi:endonuclease III